MKKKWKKNGADSGSADEPTEQIQAADDATEAAPTEPPVADHSDEPAIAPSGSDPNTPATPTWHTLVPRWLLGVAALAAGLGVFFVGVADVKDAAADHGGNHPSMSDDGQRGPFGRGGGGPGGSGPGNGGQGHR